MLDDLRAEQNKKRKALQLEKKPKRQTRDAGVQSDGGMFVKTIDASTQTDSTDILDGLKEQVQSLMKAVKELTELKKKDLNEGGKTASSALIEDEFDDDETFGSIVGDAIRTMCQEGENSDKVVYESLTLECPHQVLPNLQEQPARRTPQQRLPSYPAAVQQRIKIEGIVRLGKRMTTCALACIDVLFSEEELENGNTGGVRGFQQLNCNKMHLLMTVLRRKFETPNSRNK